MCEVKNHLLVAVVDCVLTSLFMCAPIQLLENLNSEVSRFMPRVSQVPNRMGRSVQGHWEIYEELKEGNAKEVVTIIGNHFKDSADDMEKELVK